jgi:septal ring factor EnvC (AmiA/AmiB activator)
MIPILAETSADPSGQSTLMIGVVVVALSALLQLVLAGKQLFGGNKGERQIEPTQISAITQELRQQTFTLNKVDREMGEQKERIKSVDDKISAQSVQVDNAFRRINAISQESAALIARVQGLENRENSR